MLRKLLSICCFVAFLAQMAFAQAPAHPFSKEIAPMVDIAPKLILAHDMARVRSEMAAIKSLGFKRVYLVLCNTNTKCLRRTAQW